MTRHEPAFEISSAAEQVVHHLTRLDRQISYMRSELSELGMALEALNDLAVSGAPNALEKVCDSLRDIILRHGSTLGMRK